MITLSPDQVSAKKMLSNSQMCVFSGGPGTGKTTTLSHWLRQIDSDNTWCFAPTGRAAQRMMEAFEECGVPLAAKTIHAGLIPERTGYDGGGWGFHYNKDNHLPCDRVVVDESSMIDNATMASLLQAIRPGTQVIFIGDPDQLPPVGKGRPFLDLIESGSVPHAQLTQVHRFAGRIAHVCRQVNDGKSFKTSPKLDLSNDAGEYGPENLRHVERIHASQSLEVLNSIVQKVEDRGFNPVKDMQVIVSRNDKGPVHRKLVNERLQKLLNPTGKTVSGCQYRAGDKVMCLRNAVRETYEPGGLDSPVKNGGSVYTANGEGGVVAFVGPKAIWCRFGKAVIQFKRSSWETQVCLAYAITVHKSQGGGWPVVVYLIDDTRLNDRSLVYTAISRAKKMCITIGRMATLNGQIRKVSVKQRKTFLKEMLKGEV